MWASAGEIPAIAADMVAEPALGRDERARERAGWARARERAAGV